MTTDDEIRQIAAALDATPELVPYLADLLADLWDLGSSPELIAGWLGELDLPRETCVLDLDCGKAKAVAAAARLFPSVKGWLTTKTSQSPPT